MCAGRGPIVEASQVFLRYALVVQRRRALRVCAELAYAMNFSLPAFRRVAVAARQPHARKSIFPSILKSIFILVSLATPSQISDGVLGPFARAQGNPLADRTGITPCYDANAIVAEAAGLLPARKCVRDATPRVAGSRGGRARSSPRSRCCRAVLAVVSFAPSSISGRRADRRLQRGARGCPARH